jgi:hypothetical protein
VSGRQGFFEVQAAARHREYDTPGTGVIFLGARCAMLFAEGPKTIYWFVPAFLLGYFLGLLNAWVLLVEINR